MAIHSPKHYFLRASNDFSEIVSAAESSLRKLSYEFLRNETKELVEFEVVSPKYFRVVVEKRSDPEVHTFILPSVKRMSGTTIDLRFQESGTIEAVRLFIRTLLVILPEPPWSGLRFLESRSEKRKWLAIINAK
ncbi:MAG: hypothetical protein JRN15_02900 [Nitrososphaerota archaeon]|nr:hypothetical protein [Nitrososphaerota archaeon]